DTSVMTSILRVTTSVFRSILCAIALVIGAAGMALFISDWPLARFLIEARAPYGRFIAQLLFAATVLLVAGILPLRSRRRSLRILVCAIAVVFIVTAIVALARRPAYETETARFVSQG